ncbi:hypothetical protein L1987_04022 [Smallanthus sonchifolius]|uniref:Uncharacterized protein n=1 Tax=Smallanthus sonchifolius TaxID=185202 RepID=A0ACB9KC52_9ASTR|nr:hypothetical protein L1987_04022 [Smallanthus sonchifolius]
MAAAIDKATAVAISFDEADLDFSEFGRFRFEMLAGNEADGFVVCGGGGVGNSGKNGRLSGGGAAVVGLGVNGTSDDRGEGGTLGESSGKNGWWRIRRLFAAAVAPEFVKRKKKKMGIFMGRVGGVNAGVVMAMD